MTKRIDTERQKELEPKRIEHVKKLLAKRNIPIEYESNREIRFIHKGKRIVIFPYSGWFSGKGIVDGRGISNLIKQLK